MSVPIHFALGGAGLAMDGIELGASLISKLPNLIGGPNFGDMLARSLGDSADSPSTVSEASDAKPQSANLLQLKRESAAMAKVLQTRVASLLAQHGINFGEGMTLELSGTGEIRVSDHPQAAKIESLLENNRELEQLVTSILTSEQLLRAQLSPQDGVPDIDDLEIRLRA